MQLSLILENLLSPPILFFLLGMLAVALKSDLEIPAPIPKVLALYLLLAIGFRGGVELRHSGLGPEVIRVILAAMVAAVVVPLYSYALLRRRLDVPNAAAVAATYGSVSAVTFITAGAFLNRIEVPWGGHMVAAMALMESPAIVIGVLIVRMRMRKPEDSSAPWGELLRDAFFNGSVLLLLGSLIIGAVSSDESVAALEPFTTGLFRGVLTFFLLDMGLLAARRLSDIRSAGVFLGGFAVVVPIVNAAGAIGVAWLLRLSPGDALMFTVLCASASYIAVPAAMRLCIPQANPSIYVPMSLAITFPFNIAVGIPVYLAVINWIWS